MFPLCVTVWSQILDLISDNLSYWCWPLGCCVYYWTVQRVCASLFTHLSKNCQQKWFSWVFTQQRKDDGQSVFYPNSNSGFLVVLSVAASWLLICFQKAFSGYIVALFPSLSSLFLLHMLSVWDDVVANEFLTRKKNVNIFHIFSDMVMLIIKIFHATRWEVCA